MADMRNELLNLFLDHKHNGKQIYDFELKGFLSDQVDGDYSLCPPLYRYSPANYWNIRNLETKRINLTAINKLNDVFEGLPRDTNSDELNGGVDFAYIKAFSENNGSNLMWSHYADEFRGMCVKYEFDNTVHQDSLSLKYLFPVIYSDERLVDCKFSRIGKDLATMRSDLKDGVGSDDYFFLQDTIALTLSKGVEWAYEKEWRISIGTLYLENGPVDPDEDEEDSVPIFPNKIVPFDFASAVYMGVNMIEDIKSHIAEIVDKLNEDRTKQRRKKIELFETGFDGSSYGIICKTYCR